MSPLSGTRPVDEALRPARRAAWNRELDEQIGDPYRAQHGQGYTVTHRSVRVHSYYRDLLLIEESERRVTESLERAIEHRPAPSRTCSSVGRLTAAGSARRAASCS